MKKIIALALMLCVCVTAGAQRLGNHPVGISGGYSFLTCHPNKELHGEYPDSFSGASAYQVGLATRLPVKEWFAIQPQVQFALKSLDANSAKDKGHAEYVQYDYKLRIGYVQVPVQLQYIYHLGNDFRVIPFVEPFVGVGVFKSTKGEDCGGGCDVWVSDNKESYSESGLSRVEYGAGLGAGLEWKRCQLQVKYGWNLNAIGDKDKAFGYLGPAIWRTHFRGVTLSVVYWL